MDYPRTDLVNVFQNGFGDVAFIGWLDLEEYKAAGKEMRSRKKVEKDWPVPRQPEPEFGDGEDLWSERRSYSMVEEESFRIQTQDRE
jgi:hypothetical protein